MAEKDQAQAVEEPVEEAVAQDAAAPVQEDEPVSRVQFAVAGQPRMEPPALRQQLLIALQSLNQVEAGLRIATGSVESQQDVAKARTAIDAATRNLTSAFIRTTG